MEKSINPRLKIIISMIIWGTLGLFVRGIDLSSLEIAFFRALLGSGFLILVSIVKKDAIEKNALKNNLLILSLAGIGLGINWITLFQAMKYTTISNAILSYYFAPVFIVIFSSILLKEKLSTKNIACLMGAILGLFLIMKSGNTEVISDYDHGKGILYGLTGAVLYAIVVILNKYIKGLSAFQTTLVQLSISAIVLMPIVIKNNTIKITSISINTWFLILIIGVIHTGIAYLLYFSSIKSVKSQSIAILSYLDPIVAIIISFLFLGESMNRVQVLGGVLILSTAYMSERSSSK